MAYAVAGVAAWDLLGDLDVVPGKVLVMCNVCLFSRGMIGGWLLANT